MSDKFTEDMMRAGTPFRTPPTSLAQANAYATYDLTHPRGSGDAGSGSSGIGILVLILIIAPFALVAFFGAGIAAMLIWAAQRLLFSRGGSGRPDFDNAFFTAFAGMFAMVVGTFGMALVLVVLGAVWPVAADLAYAVDAEITGVVASNLVLSSVATTIFGNDILTGLAGEPPLPLPERLGAMTVLYAPGLLAFAWILLQRVDLGVRGAGRFPVALASAAVLTLVSLPLAGWLVTRLAPYAQLAPVFDDEFFNWLLRALLVGVGVIVAGALLAALVAPLAGRLPGVRRLTLRDGWRAGLLGFSAYVAITLCTMLIFRQGDALLAWANIAVAGVIPLSSWLMLVAALGGYALVQLPGLLALGRLFGSATHGADGFTPYALTCVAAQGLALLAAVGGLLGGLLLFDTLSVALAA